MKIDYLISLIVPILMMQLPSHVVAAEGGINSQIMSRGVTVEVTKDGVMKWKGSGVIINNSNILTAAHVVDEADGMEIRIKYKAKSIPVQLTLLGNRAGTDLALLTTSLDADATGMNFKTKVPICEHDMHRAQEVDVLLSTVYFSSAGAVNPAFQIHNKSKQVTNHITAFLDHGASGGGVFDHERECLLGIISKQNINAFNAGEIEVKNYGTIITPASDISAFMQTVKVEK